MKRKLSRQFAAVLKQYGADQTLAVRARRTGLARSVLHRIILGQQGVTLDHVEQFLNRTGYKLVEIFPEEPAPPTCPPQGDPPQ